VVRAGGDRRWSWREISLWVSYCTAVVWVGDEEGGGMRCERTVRIEKGCGGLRWDTIGW